MGDWFPGIDDLLLELVEEAVILLGLLLVFRHFLPIFVFVLHLNEVIIASAAFISQSSTDTKTCDAEDSKRNDETGRIKSSAELIK